jgi:hypothetical protein
MRCVEREGVLDGVRLVIFLRVLKPTKAGQGGKVVAINLAERRKLWRQQSKKKRKLQLRAKMTKGKPLRF